MAPAPQPIRHGRDPGGSTLLIIDDDPAVRRVVMRMLAGSCRVLEAVDGLDGLRIIEEGGTVDGVLTDLNMPQLGGLELIAVLARRWPEVPVGIMSGNPAPSGPPSGIPFLQKPFSRDELTAIAAELLSRRPTGRRRGSEPIPPAGPAAGATRLGRRGSRQSSP
ncbi:MAG TPA: response regulator [Gemmatimonadales bacterium]|nr:response regulator [Gemmatimonadales bacterium]